MTAIAIHIMTVRNMNIIDTKMNGKIKVRTATSGDAQALLDIYAYYVEHTTLTFEYEVPSLEEFQSRITHILKHYPYLVAELDNEIIGYAYAGRFQLRAAYAWNAEMTIYLKQNMRRRGVGRKLYSLLEEILKAQGVVKTIAVITLPIDGYSDFNSMQFHERMGYHLAGRMDYCGYKFGNWYTTICMDKMIGIPEEKMYDVKDFEDVRGKFGI